MKNYGVWIRYESRTGSHNMYKEFRDVTLNGAVEQLYSDMASRHRVRVPSIQIIKTAQVGAKFRHLDSVRQFVENDTFPLTRKMSRASSKSYRTIYKASRPNVAMY